MTNFDKWNAVCSGLSSPQNYIDWGWISCVTAALQRRVSCGPAHMPCFANTFIILVGDPGIGKGLVIKRVDSILRHFTLDDLKKGIVAHTETDRQVAEAMIDKDIAKSEEQDTKIGTKESGAPALLFPVAANAVTYEALVNSMANCIRRINCMEEDPDGKKNKNQQFQIYTHSSLSFRLEEIASLFRKRTEDTVNFLLEAYDCRDYEYLTLSRGRDRIKKCCLNFFGGTTPDFMESTFDDKLLNQGFSSRTFYIYANKNRKNVFWIPELNEEQKKYQDELRAHIFELAKLCGRVKMGEGVENFLNTWWEDDQNNKNNRSNASLKLVPYYARKNIHVMKIAMALHFSESTSMTIELPVFKAAIEFLAKEEKNMHRALTLEGNNPLAVTSRKVIQYLKAAGAQDFKSIMLEFWGSVQKDEMVDILDHLITTDQLVGRQTTEATGENIMMYEIRKGESK